MSPKKPSLVDYTPEESPPETPEDTTTITEDASISVYSRNFEQHLIDHGIHPRGRGYSDRLRSLKPNNAEEIIQRLTQYRRSLSPSRFSQKAYSEFSREEGRIFNGKATVKTSIVPFLDGEIEDPECVAGDSSFTNLAPLTDGTLPPAKPGHFFGARPEQLHLRVRQELGDHIVPSDEDLPILPNFFLEARDPNVAVGVGQRQACYDGALAARAIQTLQSYGQEGLVYDNKAYALSCTYYDGSLNLYATYVVASKRPDGPPKYITTQLYGWSLSNGLESLRKGIKGYRNARDWAKEKRDEFIAAANERCEKALSEEFQRKPKRPRSAEESLRESKKAKICVKGSYLSDTSSDGDTKLSNRE
jgi:hypothetical protein